MSNDQVLGVSVDDVHVALAGRRQRLRRVIVQAGGHHLTKADDQVERSSQLVRDRRGKRGLHSTGLVGGPPSALELVVHALQPVLGHVQALRELTQLGLLPPRPIGLLLCPHVLTPRPLERQTYGLGSQPGHRHVGPGEHEDYPEALARQGTAQARHQQEVATHGRGGRQAADWTAEAAGEKYDEGQQMHRPARLDPDQVSGQCHQADDDGWRRRHAPVGRRGRSSPRSRRERSP